MPIARNRRSIPDLADTTRSISQIMKEGRKGSAGRNLRDDRIRDALGRSIGSRKKGAGGNTEGQVARAAAVFAASPPGIASIISSPIIGNAAGGLSDGLGNLAGSAGLNNPLRSARVIDVPGTSIQARVSEDGRRATDFRFTRNGTTFKYNTYEEAMDNFKRKTPKFYTRKERRMQLAELKDRS